VGESPETNPVRSLTSQSERILLLPWLQGTQDHPLLGLLDVPKEAHQQDVLKEYILTYKAASGSGQLNTSLSIEPQHLIT